MIVKIMSWHSSIELCCIWMIIGESKTRVMSKFGSATRLDQSRDVALELTIVDHVPVHDSM